jgi:ATP-dependent DNA helicase RecQ
LQEEIIRSVLAGRDTLALMPTGGGKSITYQVPGLMMEGTCLVVTPLIALMRDQVEELKKRGILAGAIHTGMASEEVSSIINKCIYHRLDFLYISPERLASERFRGYLKQMVISLIAVDEAHCISQWGHDFRPSYLRVAEARAYFDKVPVLALTATATPEVARDIQSRLKFREEHVLSTSFRRANLAYVARESEDKLAGLQNILLKVKGSAIVYARRRETTEKISEFLNSTGILAGYYHAGLSPLQRERRQEAWKEGWVPVIVATNAFGMGIDKADVRVVVHYDIPDSPEAYFQEAGRAGRDGTRAYAILLYNRSSVTALKERVTKGFPKKEYVKRVYEALGNFFAIPEGGGEGMAFEFDMEQFVSRFKLERAMTLSSIDILGVAGYLECTTRVNSRSRVMITVARDQLYDIDLKDPLLDRVLVALMRHCAGIFTGEVFVDEEFIAGELEVDSRTLYQAFLTLARGRIIRYVPGNDNPYIVYLMPRFPVSYLTFGPEVYENRKRSFTLKIQAIAGYVEEREECRQLYLTRYFGQTEREGCGVCDTCLDGKTRLKRGERESVDTAVLRLLSGNEMELRALVHAVEAAPEQVIERVRVLLDEGAIEYVSSDRLRGVTRR